MKISKAAFSGSSTTIQGKPKLRLPEIAFIGRSNVGKSSLINMLCTGAEKETKGKELARTSASPGKTIAINHFLIDGRWYLVDMPGYGFAKLGQAQRKELARMNAEFINRSEELATLFVLLDSRHELQAVDRQFLLSAGNAGIPIAFIFTKSDKMGKNALAKNVASVKKELLEYWEELPPCFVTSAESGTGRKEVLDYISEVLEIVRNRKTEISESNT